MRGWRREGLRRADEKEGEWLERWLRGYADLA